LLLEACSLLLEALTLSLGASTGCPSILIFGPNFSQLLAMILSSAAMVVSWPGDAWLTSIVNFFIFLSYFLIVVVSWRLQLEACGFLTLNIFPPVFEPP
jgi:hypothetical protein